MKRNLVLFSIALGIFASAFAFSGTETQSKDSCSSDEAKECAETTTCCE